MKTSAMKAMMESLPSLIMESGHPYALSRRLADDKELLSALGYSHEGTDDIKTYEIEG